MNKCLCSGPYRKTLSFNNERSLYECISCGSSLIWPIPFESGKAEDFYQKDHYLSKLSLEEQYGYFTVFQEIIGTKTPNKLAKILDFGCGSGDYVEFLLGDGFLNVTGFEINRTFVNHNSNSLKGRVKHDYNDLSGQKFDVIILNMVLEHIERPIDFLHEKVLSLLEDNGYAIVSIPNISSLNRKFLGKHWMGYSPSEHIHFLSEKYIRNVKFPAYFSLEDVRIKSSLNTRYDRWSPKGVVKKIIKNTLMRFSEAIGFGDQLIFIVRKRVNN
jgi:2-polyprenyl-3-methyl-5-hydroxy-6-metoxy-1,4-benzoquinol methylase